MKAGAVIWASMNFDHLKKSEVAPPEMLVSDVREKLYCRWPDNNERGR